MLRQNAGRMFPRFAAHRRMFIVASAVSLVSNLVKASVGVLQVLKEIYCGDVR
jgi:hypothetical protein